MELVFLPTCSSWLNWIEPEFAALRYFALGGTDHRTHAEQGAAIAAYLRWRNARLARIKRTKPICPCRRRARWSGKPRSPAVNCGHQKYPLAWARADGSLTGTVLTESCPGTLGEAAVKGWPTYSQASDG